VRAAVLNGDLGDHPVGTAKQCGRDGDAKSFADLTLMSRSTFVDCWTGRSTAFSPLRMRPA
jgi:hypothetical protein